MLKFEILLILCLLLILQYLFQQVQTMNCRYMILLNHQDHFRHKQERNLDLPLLLYEQILQYKIAGAGNEYVKNLDGWRLTIKRYEQKMQRKAEDCTKP